MGMLYSPAMVQRLSQILNYNYKTMKNNTENNAKATPKVNPNYRLTRAKRLRKYEKIDGMKVVKSDWVEPIKDKKPKLLRATTAKGRKIELRRIAQRKQYEQSRAR